MPDAHGQRRPWMGGEENENWYSGHDHPVLDLVVRVALIVVILAGATALAAVLG